jgi:hypothetical protein
MGYCFVTGFCAGCGRLFTFNPLRVPSIRVNAEGKPDPGGSRAPICEGCIAIANERRAEAGLPELSFPADAYEPVDEHELP